MESVFNEYYNWIKLYADTFGFVCIHVGDVLRSAVGKNINTLFQADGIHLTRQGHSILAEAVAAVLETLLSEA